MSEPRSGFQQGAGGAPLDRRYVRNVYQNGVQLANPTIASGFNVITSTGAFGGYGINFSPVVFGDFPRVVAWCSVASSGSFVHLSLSSILTTGFTFAMEMFSPGQVVVPVGQTVTVEWIAVGS